MKESGKEAYITKDVFDVGKSTSYLTVLQSRRGYSKNWPSYISIEEGFMIPGSQIFIR
jgi:hypothetical protein